VDATTAATLGGLVGLALGLLAVVAVRVSDRQQHPLDVIERKSDIQPGVVEVLALLRSITIVVDSSERVVTCSSSAMAHGLVRHGVIVHPELSELVVATRRDGVIREADLELRRGPMGSASLMVGVRVAPLGASHVLLLVDDRSGARQLEEMRRDFVANVSHELKTPVGGIALLGEAVLHAHDDPDAVERFATRIVSETERLSRLVQEIIDLSRLEMQHTLAEPKLVDLDEVTQEAVDRSRLSAEAKAIVVARTAQPGCFVFGDRELLVTAVRNLVGNAIAYSDSGTKVTVDVRRYGTIVEVSVSDQGQGIALSEQSRVFERFYRVDAARSRQTGGTGLGLAIVKHVCSNHGGEVVLESEEGRGSVFTMRVPAAAPVAAPPDPMIAPVLVPDPAATTNHPKPSFSTDPYRKVSP
jgi:two-component system sensor histidine kinase SenX3